MGTIGTFGSFTIARLGIYAAQGGLNVTGNNIANINTEGYTRQNLNQKSLRTGGTDRYSNTSATGSGSGVLTTGVSQTRDLYLDIRYRSEASSVGAMDSWLSGLEDIAAVLDEVGAGDGDGIIEAQFSDFIKTLQNLSMYTGQQEYETQVRTSAQTLVALFNNYASKLEDVETNITAGFKQDVTAVNEILENIQRLNSSIRKSEIHGDNALELRDERNLLIDKLSEYMDIDVVYSMEDIGEGQQVEKLTIKLANRNPDPNAVSPDGLTNTDRTVLVDGSNARRLEYSDDGNYDMSFTAFRTTVGTTVAGSTAVRLDDNDLYGSIQSMREMLTEEGEFASADDIAKDEDAAIKRGLPFYQKALDLLANKFAQVFNDANTQKDANGNVIAGGYLFSNRGDNDDPTGITASNIAISTSWSTGEVKVVHSFDPDAGNTANDNIRHMISLMDQDHIFNPQALTGTGNPDQAACDKLFSGSFQEMLSNISGVLGNDMSSTTTMLNSYYAAAVELDASRDNISSVDLNDEAANLMQYQKSYSAACRLMTVLDQVLDKLINGT